MRTMNMVGWSMNAGYHPDKTIVVRHYMIVPPASFDERSWRWWLFQQIGQLQFELDWLKKKVGDAD